MVVRRLVIAAVALFIASSVPLAQAQVTSNATCLAQYQWMDNSKSQNPCMASAYLSAECNGGQWNVPSIGNQGPYGHPTGTSANICRCNSVLYNLISACSVCQGGNAGNWANWVSNCTSGNTTIGHYPLPLPAGVAIPSWAYLDFTQQDMFQVTEAQQYAASSTAAPESMSSPGQTQAQTSLVSTTGTRTGTAAGTELPSAVPVSGGSGGGSNTGAIAGGVVGGVLGLAVLALIAFVLVRKKRQQAETAPSEKYGGHAQPDSGYPVQQPYNAGHYTPVPAPNGGYNNQGQGYVQPYGGPDTPGTGLKPYDPSDPSTFPSTPGPGNNAPTVYSQGQTEYGHQPRPGQYNYAAEL